MNWRFKIWFHIRCHFLTYIIYRLIKTTKKIVIIRQMLFFRVCVVNICFKNEVLCLYGHLLKEMPLKQIKDE